MYVENVRKAIKSLDPDETHKFLNKLRSVLRFKYSTSVKPSELRKRVEQFVSGHDPSIQSFEAYLLTFEQLYFEGAHDAIFQGKKKSPTTWRDVLILITEDQPLPSNVRIDTSDEEILVELKSLFINTIKFCSNKEKHEFLSNLRHFNNFISIPKG